MCFPSETMSGLDSFLKIYILTETFFTMMSIALKSCPHTNIVVLKTKIKLFFFQQSNKNTSSKAIVAKNNTVATLQYCLPGTPDLREFPLSTYCLLNQFPMTDTLSFRACYCLKNIILQRTESSEVS